MQFLSFWAINDALDERALCAQLEQLKEAGLDGVVFHPRNYPDKPAYMSQAYLDVVSAVILHAKSLGMSFWIYDENGWPSGTAGGLVLQRKPDLRCQWVEWTATPQGGHEAVIRSKPAVSSLDREATDLFIEITHEGYRKGLDPEAFAYVTGFFTDEVAFLDGRSVSVDRGAVPWSDRLPDMYRERYGEELEPLLPLLFTEAEGYAVVRARYWELLTDLLVESFYRPIADWCSAHGKLFTGHLKGEENPFFQLSYSGSCFHVLRELTVPGIDALERFPGNHFYPRIAHSLAVQQGRGSCLVEACGGGGWGVSPETFVNYIEWLAGHGLDVFVLHLCQYRLNTHAVHDWPPSMPLHLTWREAFPAVLDQLHRRAASRPDLRATRPELLIVTPTRGVMAAFDPRDAMVINEHNGAGVPDTASGRISNAFVQLVQDCHASGIHYELTEERTIEEIGVIRDGALIIGERAYDRVLLAEGCVWNETADGTTVVERMRRAGVRVLEAKEWAAGLATVPARTASASLPDDRRSDRGRPVPMVSSAWHAHMPSTNRLALSFREAAGGTLVAEVETEALPGQPAVELILLDEARQLSVNGHPLTSRPAEEGWRYPVPPDVFRAGGKVVVELVPCAGSESNPVAFLAGDFLVRSLSGYEEKDARQWMTAGPFRLVPPERLDAGDLIASGLPFCAEPVLLATTLRLDAAVDRVRLQLTGVHGDAARLAVDGRDLGWCWGPEWTVDLPDGLKAGEHEVAVRLVPSTYNVYGPHRHLDGDRHLVSPDQYRGVKNFADRPEAPACTLGDRWHFVKWGIAGNVRLLAVDDR